MSRLLAGHGPRAWRFARRDLLGVDPENQDGQVRSGALADREFSMSVSAKPWDKELVASWLEARIEASARDQAAADRRGYGAEDDYDKAAAEEWVCRNLKVAGREGDQASFLQRIKHLLDQDDYRITGVHDDRRVERHVRATLRKVAKMAKANEGFENRLRYQ